MMSYETFKNAIKVRVQTELPVVFKECKVQIHEVEKNNTIKEALTLDRANGMSPAVYLDDLYKTFKETQDIDDAVRFIFDINLQYNKELPTNFNMKELFASEKLMLCVINKERNKNLLEDTPHYDLFDDMAVICRCVVSEDEEGLSSAIIKNGLLEELELKKEELFKIAAGNTFKLMPIAISSMPGMLIATNENAFYGANAILNAEKLKEIAEMLEEDFYILPTSIHECIIVPTSNHELEALKNILLEGNRLCVSPEEFLSNTVYMYDNVIGAVVKAGA